MGGLKCATEISFVTNPFLETTAQPGLADPSAAQPGLGDMAAQQPRAAATLGAVPTPKAEPLAADPSVEAARRAREAKILEWVAEMRAAGHPRQALISQLAQQGVTELEAHIAVNEADLFAGMMGRPHPADIDPQVKAEIEKQGPMLVTEALANQADPVAGDERGIAQSVAQAEQMAAEGADHESVMAFLLSAGAPAEQAQELASRLTSGSEEESPKKRFSLRRNKG